MPCFFFGEFAAECLYRLPGKAVQRTKGKQKARALKRENVGLRHLSPKLLSPANQLVTVQFIRHDNLTKIRLILELCPKMYAESSKLNLQPLSNMQEACQMSKCWP